METQRKGVKDIEIPDKGIQEGKDEVLEKLIEIIRTEKINASCQQIMGSLLVKPTEPAWLNGTALTRHHGISINKLRISKRI
jgi:hypothetical protein